MSVEQQQRKKKGEIKKNHWTDHSKIILPALQEIIRKILIQMVSILGTGVPVVKRLLFEVKVLAWARTHKLKVITEEMQEAEALIRMPEESHSIALGVGCPTGDEVEHSTILVVDRSVILGVGHPTEAEVDHLTTHEAIRPIVPEVDCSTVLEVDQPILEVDC